MLIRAAVTRMPSSSGFCDCGRTALFMVFLPTTSYYLGVDSKKLRLSCCGSHRFGLHFGPLTLTCRVATSSFPVGEAPVRTTNHTSIPQTATDTNLPVTLQTSPAGWCRRADSGTRPRATRAKCLGLALSFRTCCSVERLLSPVYLIS